MEGLTKFIMPAQHSPFVFIIILLLSIISLSACTNFEGRPLYSSNERHKDKQSNKTSHKHNCIAKLINFTEVEHKRKNQGIHESFSEFGNNLLSDLKQQVKLLSDNITASECAKIYSELNYDKKLGKFNVDLSYTIVQNNDEIGVNSYSYSTRMTLDLKYVINMNGRALLRNNFITSSTVMIPESGYAYMLNLEDQKNHLAPFLAERLMLKIIRDIENFLITSKIKPHDYEIKKKKTKSLKTKDEPKEP